LPLLYLADFSLQAVSNDGDKLTPFMEGIIVKKLLLILSLMLIGLSGCYVRGYHDEGYHRGHDQHRGDDRRDDDHDRDHGDMHR